jgi:hypothetical protein
MRKTKAASVDSLQELSANFLSKALQTIGNGDKLPTHRVLRAERIDDSSSHYSARSEVHPEFAIALRYDNLLELPELLHLHALVLGDDQVRETVAADTDSQPGTASPQTTLSFYVPVLKSCIKRAGAPQVDNDELASTANRIATYLLNSVIEVKFLAPLVAYMGPEFQIDGSVRIRRLSVRELEECANLPEGIDPWHVTMGCRFAVEATSMRAREKQYSLSDAEQITRAATALRLSGQGPISCPLILPDSQARFGPVITLRMGVIDPITSIGRYVFTENPGRIRRIYAALEKRDPGLEIGLGRLEMANTRSAQTDRLIDLWVGLESLFSPADAHEVSHRMALRAAYYSSSRATREFTYRALIASYDLRCQLVHGKKTTPAETKRLRKLNLDVPKTIRLTEELLRNAVRKAVESGGLPNEEALDGAVARGVQA